MGRSCEKTEEERGQKELPVCPLLLEQQGQRKKDNNSVCFRFLLSCSFQHSSFHKRKEEKRKDTVLWAFSCSWSEFKATVLIKAPLAIRRKGLHRNSKSISSENVGKNK
jgi:hypothetical protein